MAEEHRPSDRGPVDEGNGGPVTPGGEPPPTGTNGTNGSTGSAGGTAGGAIAGGTAAKGGDGGTVIAPEPTQPTRRGAPPVTRSRVSGLWIALTLSAVVLLFLLIFILQNNVPTPIRFLGLEGTLPVGVALLFAAALGILLVAVPGCLRILQLKRAARKRELR